MLSSRFVAAVRHFRSAHRGRLIIETVGAFANESTANEPFEGAQRAVVFGCRETQRVTDGVRPPGAPDAVDVILGMFGEVIIDDV